MHCVHIHIHEALEPESLATVRAELMALQGVEDVELSLREPHDLVVEYDPMAAHPVEFMDRLERHGMHPDVTAC
ncbi:MAG TPA: hypothetical protein ENK62_07620 [Chromatiales bacterium]|nr:hypothetical protein [Chromatiales bacterium]